ncbi:MAG: TonB-dependent receptor [Bacteroidales bacterium]|nr:TonB-dependent receptor [Bacteroidales bacterium]
MKIKIISLSFLFISLNLLAQKATIKGTVKDEKTGELLFGTNIFIKGTTIGTMSDFDGNYTLSVDPGSYELTCSFVSYQTQNIKFNVAAGETKTIDFSMGTTALELNDVQVVAKRVERTESAVVAMQKNSATVISGISSQEITKSGASDAAAALKKVTGVSVQDGKYVYVRGLSDRYSKTTLNGAEISGLDPERNTVQMDLFPTNILENMLVFKAFSPDLSGDFTGGLIDIRTKDVPDKFILGFSAELSYSPQSNLINNFLTYQGGKYDALGIDDGTRAIPSEATGEIPYRLQGKDDEINNITKSFNKIWDVETKSTGLDHKYALDLGKNFKLFGKESGIIVAGTYSHSNKYDDNQRYGRYEITDPDDKSLNTISQSNYFASGKEDVMWSGLAVLGMKINNQNKVSLTVSNNHKGAKEATYMMYRDFKNSDGEIREKRILEFNSRNLFVAQLKGKRDGEKLDVDWIASYTNAKQDEPDIRFLINQFEPRITDTLYYIDPSTIPSPRRFYRNMNENVYYGRIDLSYDFKFMGSDSKLKGGFSENYKTRSYRQKQVNFYEAHQQTYSYITNYFADDNIDTENGIRAQGSLKDDQKNSYDGYMTVMGGYLMADLPLYDKYRIVAGLRVEQAYMYTESLKEAVGNQVNYGELDELSMLPSFNFTFTPNKSNNWRLAYNKTVARPSFREKSPLAIESVTGDIVIGNPNLKQTNVDNFDFRYEHYFGSGEVVSGGLFYKNFENPIEKTFNTKAQNPELTWRNVEHAQLTGIELEFAKKLDFIEILKNFKTTFNFTYVHSAVDVDPQELEIKKIYDPEISSTRIMFEQSPYIFNALLSYKNDSIDFAANISYTYNAEKLVLVNPTGIPDIYQTPTHELNFNISKTFYKKYTLQFQVKNILDQRTVYQYSYLDQDYTYSDIGYGRRFSLKLTYKF